MLKIWSALLCCTAFAACGGNGEADGGSTADTLTRAQRDSITAESALPGASVVGRALETSDVAADRAAQMDSIEL